MATINTTEDLLRLLDNNPEFLSAVRTKVLTDELLKLPPRFEAFDNRSEENFKRIDRRLDGIGGNVGALKGHFVGQRAREDAPFIAAEMGFEWIRTLERVEVLHIWQAAERNGLTEGISREDRRSFLRPDIVMEGQDHNGDKAYIAVEISYTAQSDDTERVIRNATYLTRFTDIQAFAAVASVFKDSEIDNVITEDPPQGPRAWSPSPGTIATDQESKVFWTQLEDIGSPE